LANWWAKVRERDVLYAAWRAAVLTRGETALEDDAARVYAEYPDGH